MPLYDFGCPFCGVVEERFSGLGTVRSHLCRVCGSVMNKLFSPTRLRPIMVDMTIREKRAQGMEPIGNESLDTVKKEFARQREYKRDRQRRELERTAGEVALELGDVAGAVYDAVTSPQHGNALPPAPDVSDRQGGA